MTRLEAPSSRLRVVLRSSVARSRRFRVEIRLIVGIGVIVAIIARVGTGPFLHGLLSLDVGSILAAVGFSALATAAAAWRWHLIAGRLGVGLPWFTAIRMYYQSQFINTVLPGGVIGDAQRAVAHGRSAESIGQASRAVIIERMVGQAVQLGLTLLVLVFVGAEFTGYVLTALVVVVAVFATAAIVSLSASARVRRVLQHELNELKAGLGSPGVFAQVAITSVVVVACHAATFAVATIAVGENVPPLHLLSIALVVLIGASIPLNIGGWGPREGIAGWAFALAGFGASAGVAASTLFGVLVMISIAPGAIVAALASRSIRSRPSASAPRAPEPLTPSRHAVPALPFQRQEEQS